MCTANFKPRFLLCVAVLSLAQALDGHAQIPPRKLRIDLGGDLCTTGPVMVAFNAKDELWAATPLCADLQSPCCSWELDVSKISPETTKFSLRVGSKGRTGCRRVDTIDGQLSIEFTKLGQGKILNLNINGESATYVRVVAKPIAENDVLPCTERGLVGGDVTNVQFEVEDLRLLISKKDIPACAFKINDIANLSKARTGARVPITSEVIEDQHLQATLCHRPAVMPPGVITAVLGKEKQITIEVK